MKKTSRITLLAVIIFISLTSTAFPQSISPEVISSSGGDHTTADAGLQWTLGETFTGTLGFINGNQALGFHEIFLRPGLQHSHQALALQQHLRRYHFSKPFYGQPLSVQHPKSGQGGGSHIFNDRDRAL